MNLWCPYCNPQPPVPKDHPKRWNSPNQKYIDQLLPGVYTCVIHPNEGQIKFKGPTEMVIEKVQTAIQELKNEGKVYLT